MAGVGLTGQMHGRKPFDPEYKVIVSANNDTLYLTAFADLRTEPIVLSVPPTGDGTPGLEYGPDGSLNIYLQHASPGADKESNWLPAPEGPFYLVMRIYWPEQAALDGTWTPPPVERIATFDNDGTLWCEHPVPV